MSGFCIPQRRHGPEIKGDGGRIQEPDATLVCMEAYLCEDVMHIVMNNTEFVMSCVERLRESTSTQQGIVDSMKDKFDGTHRRTIERPLAIYKDMWELEALLRFLRNRRR